MNCIYSSVTSENRSMSLIVSPVCEDLVCSTLNALYMIQCHMRNTDDNNLGYCSTVLWVSVHGYIHIDLCRVCIRTWSNGVWVSSMSTPSGCGAKTGRNQTGFAGENLACSGVVLRDHSHDHILNHTSSCCHLRSCDHCRCCSCKDLHALCDSRTARIGYASALGTTTETGCGASGCASRHSELCRCRRCLLQWVSCCYVC